MNPNLQVDELFAHVCARDFFIIGDERDGMTPPERSEEIHRTIPGSECKVY